MGYLETKDELWQLLSDVVRDEGLRLYDVKVRSQYALEVYINRLEAGSLQAENTTAAESSTNGSGPTAPAQGGVTSDDCSRVCRRLVVMLVAVGQKFGLAAEPEVEVSSPGINRTLRLKEHYCDAIGERVKVTAYSGETEMKNTETIVGELTGVCGDQIVLLDEKTNEEFACALLKVKSARVDFQFS